ncbi:regulator of chromosome condensation 1/beta-lactamase-inhibitor protein II [Pelagophyceae sp. CCMP2097]|nr:regulator of chromosome condensation 1/beta-lactamase-inhibitor protein II [Pelagophyceae sp. CCMP2097]
MAAMQANSELAVDPADEDSDEEEPKVEEVAEGEVAPPRKRRRFKLFVVFHGDRASRRLPHSVKVKCPRDGSWESGPRGPLLLKAAFAARYAEVHPRAAPLGAAETYLADQFGTPLGDDDVLDLYVESEGVLHLMLGAFGASKKPSNQVVQWGYDPLHSKDPLAPMPLRGLSRARVVKMDCGWLHAACVLEAGGAVAWGSNDFGQLGTGDELKSATPVQCKVDRDVRLVNVCCGSYFTLAVDAQGELYSWGRYQASNWPTKFTETWANGYAKRGEVGIKGEKVLLVAAGEAHVAVTTESAKLYTWGYNEQWQLGWGQGESEHQGQQKPRVVDLGKNGPSIISAENPVVSVACGGQHTCIALKDGAMYGWGSNYEGQVGHVLRSAQAEPQHVSSMEHEKCAAVNCGRYSTLAVTDAGLAYFWGSLSGSSGGGAVPAEKKEGEGEAPAFGDEAKSSAGGGGSGASRMLGGAAKQLVGSHVVSGAVGEAHGLLLQVSGVLDGWGYNAYGQAIGRIDRGTDVVDEARYVDLDDLHRPGTTEILEMCVAGGTSTILISGN